MRRSRIDAKRPLLAGLVSLLGLMWALSGSALELEDPATGRLTELAFTSDNFGVVELLVYTPPGYFEPASLGDRYPTVYWLHGSGGNHLSLATALAALPVSGSGAARKLDSLIDTGMVSPMMMVGIGAPGGSWTAALETLVTQEVPAFIDHHFRTIPRRGGRGLEGFSLGSEGVTRYVTARPDVFAAAVPLGGGFLPDLWSDEQAAILRDKLVVSQYVGDQDGFQTDAEELADTLDMLGIPNSLTVLTGAGHSASQIYTVGGISILQFHSETWDESLVVDAGADQAFDTPLPATTTLAGAISDPMGLLGTFTTTWQQVSGPTSALIDSASSLATSVELPAAGTYHFELLADGDIDLCDVVKIVVLDSGDGLEVHLSFDAGNGNDTSGNDRDATLVGGPTPFVDGRLGGAMAFDGLDDTAVVSDFSYGAAWSLALWVRAADLSGSGYQYVASHNGFDLQPSFNLYLPETSATFAESPLDLLTPPEESDAAAGSGGRVRAAVRDGDDGPGQFSTALASLEDGGWHHLILTVPETGGHRLFVDGVDMAGGSHGGASFDPSGDLFFATRSVAPSGRYFEGDLDDIRFYSRGLLAEEVVVLAAADDENAVPMVDAGADVEIYLAGGAVLEGTAIDDDPLTVAWSQQSGPGTALFADASSPVTGASFDQVGVYVLRLTADDGTTVVSDEIEVTVLTEQEPGLVGDWRMDDPYNLVALDTSGLEQDGQLTGLTGEPRWVWGQDGHALRFFGSEGHAVAIEDSPLLSAPPATHDFTVALWLRASPGAEGSIICRGTTDPSGRQLQLFLQDPNADGISDLSGIVGGLTNDQPKQLGVRVDDAAWHHVALVHEAGSATNRIFVDGNQVGAAVASGTATSPVSILVGARRVERDDTGIGFPFTGDIDGVRLYGYALSPAEVADAYVETQCSGVACPVFTDSFETGDASRWSLCEPTCP